MSQQTVSRYNNIAISLHWLMAFLILGMLGVGKFMVGLEDADPLRFTLTQWHKTFGVLILLLAVLRLSWRLTHRAPPHPAKAPKWEHAAAKFSHIAMYALLFIAPLTGWMMVSASPLNIDTLLFNVVPWPHLPWLHNLADKATAVTRYEQFHEWATGAMIALLLLHVAAALKHHFINRDTVLTGMMPSAQAGTGKTMIGVLAALIFIVGGSVFAYVNLQTNNMSLSSGTSAVSAIALVMNESTPINFGQSTVTASIDPNNLDTSSLNASVPTATVTSTNSQVQGSLPDTEWFDSENHPEATFESSKISLIAESQYTVEGTLTIKGITLPHTLTLQVEDTDGNRRASGEFAVNRMAYQLGLDSQPTGDYVGEEVTIAFEFELLTQP